MPENHQKNVLFSQWRKRTNIQENHQKSVLFSEPYLSRDASGLFIAETRGDVTGTKHSVVYGNDSKAPVVASTHTSTKHEVEHQHCSKQKVLGNICFKNSC